MTTGSPPRPVLFRPNQAALAAALGGPVAGFGVLALNLVALGRRREAGWNAVVGAAVLLVTVFLVDDLPLYLLSAVGVSVLVATHTTTRRLHEQLAATAEVLARPWTAVAGMIVAGWVAAIGVHAAWTTFGPDVMHHRVTLDSGDIVEYRGTATSAEARRAGEALVKAGALSGDTVVRIEGGNHGFALGLYLDPDEVDAQTTAELRDLAEQVGQGALDGRPAELWTCDRFGDCRRWPD